MKTDFNVVSGILELKAIKKPTNSNVVLIKNKYQGGMFCWNSLNTNTPNSGTLFRADDGTVGNWERIVNQDNTVKADWFGAVPDGVFDSTSAIQLALNYISDELDGGILLLSQGEYKTSTEIVVGKRTIIRGTGRNTTLINYIRTNSTTFKNIIRGKDQILGSNNHVGFEDFGITTQCDTINALDFTNLSSSWMKSISISMSGVNSNGIYVNDADSGIDPYYCYIENLNFTGGGESTTTAINFNNLSESSPITANTWTVIGGRITGCGTAWNIQGVGHNFIGVYCESISGSLIALGEKNVTSSVANVILGVSGENIGTYADIKAKARRNMVLPGYSTGSANNVAYPSSYQTNTSVVTGEISGSKKSNYLQIKDLPFFR
jgi:hypothetical protein